MFKFLGVFICFLMIMTFGFSNSVFAQNSAIKKQTSLADTPVKAFKIKAQSVVQLFLKLSFYLDISIGVEVSQDDKLADDKINFKGGKLSELLDQTVNFINKEKTQYSWEITDAVINIFPKNNYRERTIQALLETKIRRFSIKEGTSCDGLAKSLFETEEIVDILKANSLKFRAQDFSDLYFPQLGRNFGLVVSNMTLKSILNKVIKVSPLAKGWFIKRNSYDPLTVTLGLTAWHEDLPIKDRKIRLSEEDF